MKSDDIDWDAEVRIITSCESKIKCDFYDDDDEHQFSNYQHSYLEE